MDEYSLKTGAAKGGKITLQVLLAGILVNIAADNGLPIADGFEAALVITLAGVIEMVRNYIKTKGFIGRFFA